MLISLLSARTVSDSNKAQKAATSLDSDNTTFGVLYVFPWTKTLLSGNPCKFVLYVACTGSAREPGDLALQLGPFNMTRATIVERLGDSFDQSLFLHKFKSKCIKPSLTSIFLWYELYENKNKLGQVSIAQSIDVQCSLQVHSTTVQSKMLLFSFFLSRTFPSQIFC